VTVDHWEALFNHKYLRWFNLNGLPALMEITRVEGHVPMRLPNGEKVAKPVIHLKQIQGKITDLKPLVLNVVNGNTISTIHGPAPSGWPEKQIVLFPDKTSVGGEMKNCIRIRAPKQQQEA